MLIRFMVKNDQNCQNDPLMLKEVRARIFHHGDGHYTPGKLPKAHILDVFCVWNHFWCYSTFHYTLLFILYVFFLFLTIKHHPSPPTTPPPLPFTLRSFLGSSRPRSICEVRVGSRLRASDIDFPREMKVQYSDSSFDGNNVVNWLDDVALTNAISIVDNEVR